MQTVGIVAIALLAGLFLALLLLGLGILLWLAFRLRQQTAEVAARQSAVQTETAALLEKSHAEILRLNQEHAARLKSEVESAKAGFVTIRNDVQTAWTEQMNAISVMLVEHRREIQAGIDRINAEALQTAAARNLKAVTGLEKMVALLQQMMLESYTPKPGTEYGAEEYAPEEPTRFGTPPPTGFSVSETARLDEEAEAEQRAEAAEESIEA